MCCVVSVLWFVYVALCLFVKHVVLVMWGVSVVLRCVWIASPLCCDLLCCVVFVFVFVFVIVLWLCLCLC